MNTKQRILETALTLFNKEGYSNISSKKISEEIGMSYGNLCYHFPKKDDIVMRLHQNLLDEMDESIQNLEGEIFEFDFMLKSLKQLMDLTLKYRFFLLNSYDITTKYPRIKEKTIERAKVYHNVIYRISKFLMENGYMTPSNDEKLLKKKIHGLLIIFNSWTVDLAVFYDKPSSASKSSKYYIQLLFAMIDSSLTKKGRDSFSYVYGTIVNK
ncbi:MULTISPECIES: TetR/AcrR family transcriptional regulator [Tenacibaculum]|uniref:TetR/AcrR family transcriptional regulator n=1 Tax=Tenacibaculum TaxID=104267 RepID=UPI001F409114|nr:MULTISPECIES: TetR/AcrR family transcriptional regulator [Tenacibaculum]MCF2873975.1 TetR/AcrR family transcriptional regulator [Tenacibaculum sp. Cn5-1]MCF2934556.1 TetR/AcrR family transcriptional regulator [Tenacibaculum sp. Cn5-34]MCG7510766.1 TetR/AcrR family transcriptional regulator [Tenacibaculum sp. Cn5-46]